MMACIHHRLEIIDAKTYLARLADLREKGATGGYVYRMTVHIYDSLILTPTKTPPYQLWATVYTIHKPWDEVSVMYEA
jgi:hypothetical protein